MKMIRPVSDLRNNFADISKTVHETSEPVCRRQSVSQSYWTNAILLKMC